MDFENENKGRDRKPNRIWKWKFRSRRNRTAHDSADPVFWPAKQCAGLAPLTTLTRVCKSLWLYFTAINAWRQILALCLVLAGGVTPFAIVGYFSTIGLYAMSRWYRPFSALFSDKTILCQDSLGGVPLNSSVTGVEKIFVLDRLFYHNFSFAQAKMVDALWDILVGRGIQIIAAWAAYIVFSDALLRVIERHPASFQIFQRITLEGPGLLSVWTLIKEIWTAKSRRTKALFFYMLLSTSYILWIPLLLSAMTGYSSSTITWVNLDNPHQMTPVNALRRSQWMVAGANNVTFAGLTCIDENIALDAEALTYARDSHCQCQFPNGTMMVERLQTLLKDYGREGCTYRYPGNNQTYTKPWRKKPAELGSCTSTFDVTVNGTTYDAGDIKWETGWCFDSRGYPAGAVFTNSHCLPDNINPTYKWGFSTILSGIFSIIHLAWSITMYIVWQDAQFNSSLVKSRYAMTPLRAAFAMTKAAKRHTGLHEKQLVRTDTSTVEKKVYGTWNTKAAVLDYGIFADRPDDTALSEEGVRRRNVEAERGLNPSEVTLTKDME